MSCHHTTKPSEGYPQLNYTAGAKWVKNLTQSRLGTFQGGHYSDMNLSSVLFTHRVDNDTHVKLQVWSAPGLTKPTFKEAMKQDFRPARKGDSFGPSWTNHWWKVSLTIPGYWQQYETVQFEFDPGCEAMVYTTDGLPLQGITGGYGGDRRVEHIIPPEARKKGKYEIVIESTCNGMFGVPWNGDTIEPPDMNRYFGLASADLVVPNHEAWHLLWDFQTLREIIDNLWGNTPLQNQALVAANEIINVFHKEDVSSIGKARKLAEEVFGVGWQAKGAGIYDEGEKDSRVWGIGHCHIDTAWLWPYHVTQQKVARSWSTQVDLMERYPEHRFSCSQAQQFKWLEQLYPPLYEKVKEKVLDGRFQPVGGSWVENDSNMPSGEALIRQFLFGQRYFESKFGKRCDTAWLPDSFGLTGSLPQLIRGAGMKYFFTQKLSWNNINNFPHSTFNWVGIDGTQVLCHMTPVETYTAQATVGDVKKGIENHKNLESSATALLVFGNGDGGGGPLPKMLENLRRIRAVTNTHRELVSVNMGHSVDEFFDMLLSTTGQGSKLPNWHGELYLEFHRGTYTSHGSIKKGNRHSEILMRDIEQLATLASLFKPSDYKYPRKEINDNWEKVLLNQFHDILPGSAIGMAYDEAEEYYAQVFKSGKVLLEDAFKVLFPNSVSVTSPEFNSKTANLANIFAVNTTFFPRREIVKVPVLGSVKDLKNKLIQTSKDGKDGYVMMGCGPATTSVGLVNDLGGPSLTEVPLPVAVYTNGSDHFVLRNASVQLTISNGRITSLLDVQQGRELLTEGATGGLIIFEDRPNYWDAWDVEIHHLEMPHPLEFSNMSVVAHGPLRASVRAEVKYGQSTISVTISLDAVPATTKLNSRSMFVFDAVVDWHQRHEFLKFELPLNLHSDFATYEMQFGHVQRPTHKNTTWDIAKFEVCGHKYADLSEYGYGVAILSESKYGFSCLGNILRISLLRSATAPDAEQDQGEHKFSWAVMPHVGSFLESDVPMAAYLFNSPLYLRHGDIANELASSAPFAVHGAPNVFLETVKRGEDDTKDVTTVVLRLYEAFGGHARAALRVGSGIYVKKAFLTNLLEDDLDATEVAVSESGSRGGGSIKLDFHRFEVKTVKLVIGKVGKRDSWVNVDRF
ncbi:glycoside hydrolase family 38 protein [Desarmillaria tabescens]|uniref:Alpha-mannosidase n=1 Tax=Armillaria tabescens TaxID=1929756 RepID=A0AA39KCB4_ARMTA|nr:glycoside hydrolase family 38 protein [Desarmillaria tabescens]KAK0458541.1 glycoside hydrolase family 38 protein [Desarmillaria tabescens]